MTDVVLWRHGRTEYNAARRLQGQIDIPLDEVGRWQGTTAAAALFARHTPVRIVSSDLVRAFDYSEAELVGKGAHYTYFEGSNTTMLRLPGLEHRYAHLSYRLGR